MNIERTDGTKERRTYDTVEEMMADAQKVVRDPSVKRVTLYPKLTTPKKRRR